MPNYENLYRSTTPKIILHIKDEEFDMSSIDICHITIENDSGRNKKTFDNAEINENARTITLELTQEETAAFEPGMINLQLKLKTHDGKVLASRIVNATINDILEEAVI